MDALKLASVEHTVLSGAFPTPLRNLGFSPYLMSHTGLSGGESGKVIGMEVGIQLSIFEHGHRVLTCELATPPPDHIPASVVLTEKSNVECPRGRSMPLAEIPAYPLLDNGIRLMPSASLCCPYRE